MCKRDRSGATTAVIIRRQPPPRSPFEANGWDALRAQLRDVALPGGDRMTNQVGAGFDALCERLCRQDGRGRASVGVTGCMGWLGEVPRGWCVCASGGGRTLHDAT